LLNGGIISGNTSEYAGGVYMTQGARLVMAGTAEIRGNSATRGGGVYVANGAQLVLEGGTVQNNTPDDVYE
jgi:lipopolysaccharide export system protein LptA